MSKRVFMTDAARKILATRDELPKRVANEAMLEESNERIDMCDCALPTLDAFRRSMRDAMRSGKSFSRAIRRSVRDQMGAGGPSTGGSPEKTPGPGFEGIQTAPEYQPNAASTIRVNSSLSTVAPTLNMGQVWGAKEKLPTEQVNAHGFPMGNPSSPSTTDRVVYTQIIRPGRATTDAARANIRQREAEAASSSATIAAINAKHRAHRWGS